MLPKYYILWLKPLIELEWRLELQFGLKIITFLNLNSTYSTSSLTLILKGEVWGLELRDSSLTSLRFELIIKKIKNP